MTARELYERAKALMFEKSTSRDYDNYYIPWTNTLLREQFDLNNHLRLKHGKEELTEIPEIVSGDDDIPYEVEMLNEILPYGLAANFFIDDDLSKFDLFNTKYENAMSKYSWGTEVTVEDVYGGVE